MKKTLLTSLISVQFYVVLYLLLLSIFNIEIGSLYIPLMIGLLILSIFYEIKAILSKHRISKYILVTFIIYIFLAIYIYINGSNMFDNFIILLQSILWVIPVVILCVNIEDFSLKSLEKYFIVFYFMVGITLLISIEIPYYFSNNNIIDSSLVINHQTISYLSSFCYGIGLYFIGKKNNILNLLIILIELINIHVTFLSGGRGGAILLLCYTLFYILEVLRNKNLIVKFFLTLGIAIFGFMLASYFKGSQLLTRSFSYIDDNGLNLENTSGRDELYSHTISLISEKLWFGHGMFTYYNIIKGTPHNLILEILLIGGIFLLMLIALISFSIAIKFYKIYNRKSLDRLVIYLFIYPITMLMFSGNFLLTGILWFCILYILRRIMGYKGEYKKFT